MARTQSVSFENGAGHRLAGLFDLPLGKPRAWALFAHCFTCSKDFPAAVRLGRALAEHGFAVLRFDFTGLGASEGDFESATFSSDVDDLVAAAEWLRAEHGPPRLLVGHSLGGAAVLAAARRIEGVEAVATIGAPADPLHLKRHFPDAVARIEREGRADVTIGGRPFTLSKRFLEDIDKDRLGEHLGALRAALLVMHAPLDDVVSIENAELIYRAARGYKSFVSLADADHVLGKRGDAEYAASILAAWAERYVTFETDETTVPEGTVRVEEYERPYTQRVLARHHVLLADEPPRVKGALDAGPTPFELLLAGLGACTSMTLRMYAERKQWPVERLRVDLTHSKIHVDECASCESDQERVDRITCDVTIEGEALSDEQRARLLEIAERCPVHRTLKGEKEIVTRLSR